MSASQNTGSGSHLNPGDEAEEGTLGSGEEVCPVCGGSGKLASGSVCDNCGGSGHIIQGIGGG